MLERSARNTVLGAALVGAAAVLAAGVFGLPVGKAEAQNIMAAPTCQCSAAIAIDGMTTKVAHCICGVMQCVIGESPAQSKVPGLLQCVR